MKNKIIKVAAILSLLCMTNFPVYAASAGSTQPMTSKHKPVQNKSSEVKKETTSEKKEDNTKESAAFYFVVYLDSGISLTQNDNFKITLKDTNNQTHTIEMNAYEASNAVIEREIDEGTYTVSSLEYKGINSVIMDNGYGLPIQITLSSKESTEIPFYIGSEQTMVSGLFAIKNGISVQTTQSTEQTQDSTDTSSSVNTGQSVESDTGTDANTNTVAQPDEDDVVEVVNQENKKNKRNTQYIPFSAKKMIPIGLVAIIGITGILIYYKRNYKA